jgi:hypothetical protein
VKIEVFFMPGHRARRRALHKAFVGSDGQSHGHIARRLDTIRSDSTME